MASNTYESKAPLTLSESGSSSPTASAAPKAVDSALTYLRDHEGKADIAIAQDAAFLQALRRKIDWRIIPFMCLCYTMQFIDKVAINYAAVMGLRKDAKLVGNNFSNAASAFFIACLVAAVPNVFLLQKLPTAKWLGFNVFCWGITTACTGAVHNYGGLLTTRILSGVFECAVAPSLMLLSSQWYTKKEQASRFAFWYVGLGLGQIFGGLLSYAFQHVKHGSLEGWRILFIVLGVVSSLIGVGTFFGVPDTPMKAYFLSESEKVVLLEHVKVNKTGIDNKQFNFKQIFESLIDVQLWFLAFIVILQSVSSGVITSYSATLIRSFGYSPTHSALLNMPSGAVSIFFTLLVGFGVRITGHRWAWIAFCSIPAIIGGALMSFLPHGHRGGLLAGNYLVNAIVAPLPIIYQWIAANCAGQTKRAFASAIISASFSVGNIIGPQTFQAKDAPQYKPAKIALIATQAAAMFLTILLFFYYIWANKSRASLTLSETQKDTSIQEAWDGKTDKENKSFRYEY
ncbi:putative MFS transporter [Xylona heveae TC161]|uniref:Putative MFS transporter n=1 Tax=Xylona heveae (strain CBS 132557 / TC161) TaxID=1328760 RepID=A0A165HFS6_XYLHT|nr:putative MFS transporter [Xylona heveae TC161]KZF23446.1 putative MFS transporter [Xylona heveae TC161]